MEPTRRTFAIDSCLGRGGFGEVYRAEMTSSTGLSTAVALKVLRRDVAPNGQAAQRLKDEARALARVNHPAILRVHDLVVLEGRVSLVTEFVDGEDLEQCLRDDDRISIRGLVEVLMQVAAALDAVWTAPIGEGGGPLKLVHRDVKPSNIRIGRHADVKLLDFGISRTDEVTREARTQTDMMVGSPPYMAPERYLEAAPNPASDVFSLGCILLERIVGRRVFDLPVAMLASLAVDRRRYEAHIQSALAECPRGTPAAVVALASEMLQYDPAERPPASEVAARMDLLIDQLEGVTLAKFCRERRWRDPPPQVGDLLGRVVSEGSLERPTTDGFVEDFGVEPPTALPPALAQRPTRPARTGTLVWLGGAGVVSGFAGLLGLVLLALLLVWLAWWAGQLEPAPAPIPVPGTPAGPPPDVPVPISDPTLEAPPAAPPEAPGEAPRAPPGAPPDARRPAPPADPAPEPDPVAPVVPVPTRPPVSREPPVALVAVRADGVNWAKLTVSGAQVTLPARVPPGSYALDAEFPDGVVEHLQVAVPQGGEYVIVCSSRMGRVCR